MPLTILKSGKIGLKKCAEFAHNSRKLRAEFSVCWRRILTTLNITIPTVNQMITATQ